MKHCCRRGARAARAAVAPASAEPSAALDLRVRRADVSAAPDKARIDAGVTSEAKTAREATDANNAAMGEVMMALKGASIDEHDFHTSRMSLQPHMRRPHRRAVHNAITGYRASNRVSMRLRDATKVAGTIDALVGAGANEIGGINFVVSEPSKALDEARARPLPTPAARPNLCKGRWRDARRALQHFRRRPGPPPVFRGKMAAPMAIMRRWRRASRRCR